MPLLFQDEGLELEREQAQTVRFLQLIRASFLSLPYSMERKDCRGKEPLLAEALDGKESCFSDFSADFSSV